MSTNNIDKQTFTYFPKLPPGIRAMVWREFLRCESRSRFIWANRWAPHLMPEAHLVSPLLKVTIESRVAALKFYTTKLDVYEIYLMGTKLPLYSVPTRLSYFPKGYLYLCVPEDRFKDKSDNPYRPMLIMRPELHLKRTFAKSEPEVGFLGLLTGEVFDEDPPFRELVTSV